MRAADEFADVGDEGDLRVRSEVLEAVMERLGSLGTDEDVAFRGRHRDVTTCGFGKPHAGRKVPIWIGATVRPLGLPSRADADRPRILP